MKINTNIAALRANFNLNSVQSKLTQSTNRLSSGYRINKAADDAAGLAIAHKMHAQIRGLERASKNGSDAESLIQTAEGALSEIESMLQRCRELSVQAANDTNTLEDKQTIQDEIDELRKEIDRVSEETEFNALSVLNGSCCRQSSSNNIGVKLISASDDVALDNYKFTVDVEATQTEAVSGAIGFNPTDVVTSDEAGVIQINGEDIEVKEGKTYEEVFASIRDYCEFMNIDVKPVDGAGDETNLSTASALKYTCNIYGESQDISIKTNNAALAAKLGVDGTSITKGQDASVTLDTTSGYSTTATVFTEGNRVTVTDRGGFEMIFDVAGAGAGKSATVTMLNAGYLSIQIGANEGQTIDISIPSVSTKALNINDCNVCTHDGAQNSIEKFGNAIEMISSVRSKLGAYQNRMDSAITNLNSSSENLTEACSRIEDVDMSEEMTKYTQYSVLVQAGTSMLAQANNQPQNILQLLQG